MRLEADHCSTSTAVCLRPVDAASPGAVSAEQERSHTLLEAERERAGVQAELVSVVSEQPRQGYAPAGRGATGRPDRRRHLLARHLRPGGCWRRRPRRAERLPLCGERSPPTATRRGHAIAKIGVGYDGSPESEAALAMAPSCRPTRTSVIALEADVVPSWPTPAGLAAIGETMEMMIEEGEGAHRDCRMSMVAPCMVSSPARSWRRLATSWTSWWSATGYGPVKPGRRQHLRDLERRARASSFWCCRASQLTPSLGRRGAKCACSPDREVCQLAAIGACLLGHSTAPNVQVK